MLVKPDGIIRGLVGRVISRFEDKGIKVVGMKMLKMNKDMAREHYAHLINKPFYLELEAFMTHMPIIAMVLEGKDVVNVVRRMVGSTNARDADPGTIRGDFSMSVSKNIVHASDSKETAKVEIKRFFKEYEIYSYEIPDYVYSFDER